MSQFRMPKRPGPTPEELARVCSRMSGLAVTSLVFGILGFFTCGITGLIGLLLGTVALVVINKSGGELRGHGLAVSGIIVSGVSMLSLVAYGLIAAIVTPQLALATDDPEYDTALSRLQNVSSMSAVYGRAHDDHLPPADNWVKALGLWDPSTLESPLAPDRGRAYAMNIHLDRMSRRRVHEPHRTVLFFEARFDSPLAGGPELLPPTPRFPDGYLIVYVNGTMGFIPSSQLSGLVWEP